MIGFRFATAVDQTRWQSDWEWLAASLEGMCAAILLGEYYGLQDSETFTSSSSATTSSAGNRDLVTEVIEKYTEAITFYARRRATIGEVEARLRFVRFLIDRDRRTMANEQLIDIDLTCSAQLQPSQKAILQAVIANFYSLLRMRRKCGFHLRAAALAFADLKNIQTARALLQMAAPHYKLRVDLIDFRQNENQIDQTQKRLKNQIQQMEAGWPALQREIAELLMRFSIEVGGSSTINQSIDQTLPFN